MGIRRILLGAAMIAIALVVMASGVQAEIPRKINYQARLTDPSTGEPLGGSLNLTFRIYDDPLYGSLIWEEGQTLAADSAGVVSAILGSIVPIDIGLGDASWLEVEVNGQVLLPRREIVSVPYAFRALDSDSLGGYEACDFVVKGEEGSITVEMIVGGTGSGLNADLLDSLSAEAFADSGHTHDGLYYRKEELNTSGTINDSGNPVAWTKLKDVPAGFADGTDDGGGSGDGHSLDAADGSPIDVVFVNNDGDVGIGTTTPDDNLDIVGDADLTGDLKMAGARVLSADAYGTTAIGFNAGHRPGGSHNTFLGYSAGNTSMTGSQNVFVGSGSGQANTIGNANTVTGYHAGAGNENGWGNTFMGYSAGSDNVDGFINTFLGYYAGRANTGGSGNTFLGSSAGWLNVDGQYNTSVGGAAGYSNVDGEGNTYLGYAAGYSNANGEGNVFLGQHAGYLETGSNKLYIANDINDPPLIYGDFSTKQVGIGTRTLQAELDVAGGCNVSTAYSIAGSTVVAVPGDRNTHLGVEAGAGNTSYKGTFVGYRSGSLNESFGNTFVGAEAGRKNTSGFHNTFLGASAGQENQSGRLNTFIGSQAGMFDEDGDFNVCVGSSAGGISSSSSRNTLVGYRAGTMCGSGNVFIGYLAGTMATDSNKLIIANDEHDYDALIYGDFSTHQLSFGGVRSGYTFEFVSNSTNAFRLGHVNSWVTVHTGGNTRMGFGDGNGNEAGYIAAGENGSGENTLGIHACMDVGGCIGGLTLHENGYVGLGTDDPDRDLHIAGNNPRILIEAQKSNPEVNFRSSDDAFGDTWAVYKDSTSNGLRFYQNGDKVIFEGGTGNVGIGTDPGGFKLRVNGSACGTSPWAVCSDLKFKDNIATVGDALGKVLSLRGVTFDWKTDEYPDKNFDEGTHYGCIAQEVEAILPEVVLEGPDGDKAVAYTEIVPVLIESIKAQQIQIEGLRAEVEELRSALAAKD